MRPGGWHRNLRIAGLHEVRRVVAAIAFDRTGNYEAILWVFAVLKTMAAFSWMLAPPPAKAVAAASDPLP